MDELHDRYVYQSDFVGKTAEEWEYIDSDPSIAIQSFTETIFFDLR